jgi:hypothetical protein
VVEDYKTAIADFKQPATGNSSEIALITFPQPSHTVEQANNGEKLVPFPQPNQKPATSACDEQFLIPFSPQTNNIVKAGCGSGSLVPFTNQVAKSPPPPEISHQSPPPRSVSEQIF